MHKRLGEAQYVLGSQHSMSHAAQPHSASGVVLSKGALVTSNYSDLSALTTILQARDSLSDIMMISCDIGLQGNQSW
jgi:hypothetical protein